MLSLIVTVNGPVHKWHYAYETSLTRASTVVVLRTNPYSHPWRLPCPAA
jgi:hypothetical protein